MKKKKKTEISQGNNFSDVNMQSIFSILCDRTRFSRHLRRCISVIIVSDFEFRTRWMLSFLVE